MAFRLTVNQSVAAGLRRVAREELNSLSKHLSGAAPPRGEAIHEVRKSVKKLSAILQVVDADNGRGLAKDANRLHTIHHRLSALRDADVMLDTLRKLRVKDRRILTEQCFARVQRRLSSHKKLAMKAARRKRTWRRIARSLRKVRRDARHWTPRHRQFGSLAAGIRRTHQQGRKAMARAEGRQRAADFHNWRKQVKALWYELRLLEGSTPRVRRDVQALHRAEAWLGDEHNVVVLCAELAKDEPHGESRIDLDRVRLAGDRYQSELRTKALAITKRIYERKPREYAEAIRREWKNKETSN